MAKNIGIAILRQQFPTIDKCCMWLLRHQLKIPEKRHVKHNDVHCVFEYCGRIFDKYNMFDNIDLKYLSNILQSGICKIDDEKVDTAFITIEQDYEGISFNHIAKESITKYHNRLLTYIGRKMNQADADKITDTIQKSLRWKQYVELKKEFGE